MGFQLVHFGCWHIAYSLYLMSGPQSINTYLLRGPKSAWEPEARQTLVGNTLKLYIPERLLI